MKKFLTTLFFLSLSYNIYHYIDNLTILEQETKINFSDISKLLKSGYLFIFQIDQSTIYDDKEFIIKSFKENTSNCVYFRIILLGLSLLFICFLEQISLLFSMNEYLLFLICTPVHISNEYFIKLAFKSILVVGIYYQANYQTSIGRYSYTRSKSSSMLNFNHIKHNLPLKKEDFFDDTNILNKTENLSSFKKMKEN